MASKIKVDQIEGAGGTTVTVPSGQTLDVSSATVTLPNGAVSAAKLNADVISGQTELTSSPEDTDEFLISDAGVLKRIDASLIGGGGFQSIQTFTSSGNATYTKPTGIKKIRVYVTGGGAGGSGAASSGDYGGGGGAGGTAIEVLDATSINTVTVTVGAGGAGVTGDHHGNSGGSSSFGSFCSASGGGVGRHGNAGHVFGGLGGTASGGDINIQGGAGVTGDDSDNDHMSAGIGGASFWTGGGRGQTNSASYDGSAGNFGSGGGGGSNGQTSFAGGTGFVLVEEYK